MEIIVYDKSGNFNYSIMNVVEFLIDNDDKELDITAFSKRRSSLKRYVLPFDNEHHNFKVVF